MPLNVLYPPIKKPRPRLGKTRCMLFTLPNETERLKRKRWKTVDVENVNKMIAGVATVTTD